MTRFIRFWIRLGLVLGVAWTGMATWVVVERHQTEREGILAPWEESIRNRTWMEVRRREAAQRNGMLPDTNSPEFQNAVDVLARQRMASSTPPDVPSFPTLSLVALAFLPLALYAGVGWAVNAFFLSEPQR